MRAADLYSRRTSRGPRIEPEATAQDAFTRVGDGVCAFVARSLFHERNGAKPTAAWGIRKYSFISIVHNPNVCILLPVEQDTLFAVLTAVLSYMHLRELNVLRTNLVALPQ